MQTPNFISERVSFLTTRITCSDAYGKESVGTGFFFSYQVRGTLEHFLVTNKHVVKKSITGSFRVHPSETIEGKIQPSIYEFVRFDFGPYKDEWFPHPEKSIDLCVLPFSNVKRSSHAGRKLYIIPLKSEQIWTDEKLQTLSANEQVLMVGYPLGLFDEVTTLPILRRGYTAFHPGLEYQYQPQGLLDMAVFPGSSGSPVITVSDGIFKDGKTTRIGERNIFLGILFASPKYGKTNRLSPNRIPTRLRKRKKFNPPHLGYYIRAKELITLLQSYESMLA